MAGRREEEVTELLIFFVCSMALPRPEPLYYTSLVALNFLSVVLARAAVTGRQKRAGELKWLNPFLKRQPYALPEVGNDVGLMDFRLDFLQEVLVDRH